MTLLRRTAGVVGELLITLGALLLLFIVWQLWWTDVTAGREQAGTVSSLERQFDAPTHPAATTPTASPSAAPRDQPPVRQAKDGPLVTFTDVPQGRAFAIIRVPRFGQDYARPILQGTGTDILQEGVGHYLGTAMPGQVGNFAIAGHRTTYAKPFHDIDRLRPGDVIIIETKRDYVVYAVRRHTIVRPWQTDVIAPVPQHPGRQPTERWLTLTSCHPRYSAAYRYISFARFTEKVPRSQGLPASLLEVKS